MSNIVTYINKDGKEVATEFRSTQLFTVPCGCQYRTELLDGHGPELFDLCGYGHTVLVMSVRAVWPVRKVAEWLFYLHLSRTENEAEKTAREVAV